MMGKLPFEKRTIVLANETLKVLMENDLLELHPELLGHQVEIEMIMNCDNETITLKYELCEKPQLYLVRPERGKHLDS